jgi:uncharacterized damage-inducible protein DinB
MKPFFKELLEYGHHINQQLSAVIIDNHDKVSDKSLRLFNHILNAHQIWNNRIQPRESSYGVWEVRPHSEFMITDTRNYEHSLTIVDEFDLNDIIEYSNSQGKTFQNSVRDVLFHIVNHSTYHRAQIASDFKQSGITPLVSDYIHYKRI